MHTSFGFLRSRPETKKVSVGTRRTSANPVRDCAGTELYNDPVHFNENHDACACRCLTLPVASHFLPGSLTRACWSLGLHPIGYLLYTLTQWGRQTITFGGSGPWFQSFQGFWPWA